jgi:hypothetical protein
MSVEKFAVHLRAAFAALAIASFVLPAQAQQPSAAAVAMAKEVLAMKGADKLFNPLVLGIVTRIKGTLLQTNLDLSKELDEVANKLARELTPRLGELNQFTANLYARQFTEDELKQIIAFYKSPIGKKVINLEPQILDQSMANADAWAVKMEQEVLDRFRAEMKKKGHNL